MTNMEFKMENIKEIMETNGMVSKDRLIWEKPIQCQEIEIEDIFLIVRCYHGM